MYEERFGFTGRPFQLTPDPAFWYETVTHRKAMAYLGYGLAQGEGFIVVTGDIGAGKTTLMAHLLDTIDPQALNAIKLVSTAIEADDLLRIVATALGIETVGLAKAQLLTAIERGLHGVARSGRRTLLLVDEAQALPVSALEELRMLSNFQLGGHALVQIVLMGQPEFRDRLNGADRLEQLRQRVIAIHHLDPMGADEIAPYLTHRLAMVGWTGTPGFTDDAYTAFYDYSGGIPRRLNQLAGRVLLQAGIEDRVLIDAMQVRGVAEDLRADLPAATLAPAPASAPAGLDVPLPSWLDIPETRPEPVHAAPIEDAFGEGTDWSDELPLSELPAPPIAFDATSSDQDIVPPSEQIPPIDEPVDDAGQAIVVDDSSVTDDARIAALEERVDAQDAALRRVLTLLVDWVESDVPRGSLSPLRDAAA